MRPAWFGFGCMASLGPVAIQRAARLQGKSTLACKSLSVWSLCCRESFDSQFAPALFSLPKIVLHLLV